MPSLETFTANHTAAVWVSKPTFGVVKSIPEGASPQIERAVLDFMQSSHTPEGIDLKGFQQKTLEAIASATYLGGGGDFWLGMLNGEVLIYILAFVANDLDGRLAYHVQQGWVRKDYRGKPIVKEWWQAIRKRAKDNFCKHLVITSTRNPKAYERFLGHGMKLYANLLKEEI